MVRWLLLFFLFIFQFTISQDFEARVSDRQVGVEESFKIEFIINDSGKNFSPPSFKNFYVLSGPSTSKSTSWVNGSFKQESRYTYILKPKTSGVFTILPATIQIKGKTIGSQPITIEVKKGLVSKKPNTPYNIAARNIHLEVKSNKSQVYVGEPIVLTYILYFNLGVGGLSPNKITYSNFLTDDVDLEDDIITRRYKGTDYKSAVIKQVILTPQSDGLQEIEKLKIDLTVSVPTNNVDFFGRPRSQQINYMISSNDISIDVLPLPSKNKPSNFSGAVGDFKLMVELDKDQINVNESASYQVTIEGIGNLNVLTNPKVYFENDLEDFEPNSSDKVNFTKNGYSGYKKDAYLIVPRKKGVYNFKPVEFNFFSTKTKSYVTLFSSEKELRVDGDKFNYLEETEFSQNQEKIEFLNKDIRFIKTNYDNQLINNFLSNIVVVYFLFCLPFLLVFLALLYKKGFLNNLFSKQSVKRQVDGKINIAHNLINIKKYQECNLILLELMFLYVSLKFSINQAVLSTDRIQEALVNGGVDQSLVSHYLALIKRLELYRYASSEDLFEGLNKDFVDEVSVVINKIEKEL